MAHVPGARAAPGRAIARYNKQAVDEYQQNLVLRAQESAGRHQQEEKKIEKQIHQKEKESKPKLPPDQRPLKIETAEFYARNNSTEHHTDRYELVELSPSVPVLRRGQPFYMAIRIKNRPYNPEKDFIKLIFLFGPKPNIARGTRAEVFVGTNKNFVKSPGKWDVRIHHEDQKTITLHVSIPPSLYVGLWKCRIQTGLKADPERRKRFDCNEDLYVLFNPWCKDDPVFMDNEAWRREYVLNDVGKIYIGVHNAPRSRSWVYGQFDDVVLPACMLLLDRAKLDYTARGDPIKIVRAISAAINSRDDDGLLVDNWSGDYAGGTSPMDWTGSLKIIEQYASSGGHPVKYGQCWVFSGCVTTICRALGIPCRSVTNYVSAHDCHHNLTVDKFHDSEGELKNDLEDQDAVWNFHVWNEVWMTRPDLPKGYGGWQVIDATPQEQSEDTFQMGPASVEAVRRGEIGLQYDTMFVLSEVNADVIHWQDDEEAEIGMRQIKSFKYYIGKKILTKAPGKDDDKGVADAEDLLPFYKNPEGSQEERMQVMNAARNAHLWYLYDAPKRGAEDVAFDLLEIDSIMIGEPFKIIVKVQNNSDEMRTIVAILCASTVYYTGITCHLIRKEKQHFQLAAKQNRTLEVHIQPPHYMSKLTDYSMLKIYSMATVEETRQTWTEEDDFSVEKPTISLEVRGTPKVGQDFTLVCKFKNVLLQTLQNCHFSFEGPGLSRPKTVPFRDVQAGELVYHEEKFVPLRSGERKIVVTFGSSLLNELIGSTCVNVNPA